MRHKYTAHIGHGETTYDALRESTYDKTIIEIKEDGVIIHREDVGRERSNTEYPRDAAFLLANEAQSRVRELISIYEAKDYLRERAEIIEIFKTLFDETYNNVDKVIDACATKVMLLMEGKKV
jgi:hypothetical protein